jgi:trehalose 6-phosphate phosphatase
MTSLFTEVGRASLTRFLMSPVLCLFDFDGTLAPLVSDPALVWLPQSVQQHLQALQQRTPVGIITGRSLHDLQRRLAFEPDYVIGNHGLEGLPGWQQQAVRHAQTCREWQAALQSRVPDMGKAVWIEDKIYSLTVHYRDASDPHRVEEVLRTAVLSLHPSPRIIAGKGNFSLLPPNAGDKGQAVCQLLALSKRNRALYVGDDTTDEDVFALHHPGIFSVRVGPTEATAADYVIEDHAAVGHLLTLLLTLLPKIASAYNVHSDEDQS